MRPFLALDRDARRSSRIPSLLAGLAVFVPFFSLAQRMGATSPLALALAGLALAFGPLHIQVSTTAASEALYLLLFVTTMERLHAALTARRWRDFFFAGVCGSLAAVTRYDMWLSLPAAGAAALWWGPRDRRALGEVAVFLGTSAILPAAYLAWLRAATGDPLFFAHFIASDHKAMAAAVSARLGPALARLRQVVIWLLAFATALTPVPFMAMAGVIRARPADRQANPGGPGGGLRPHRRVSRAGVGSGPVRAAPAVCDRARSDLCCRSRRRIWRRPGPDRGSSPLTWQTAGFALALAGVIAVLAHGWPGRIWGGAESFEAVTRLDGEDRELAGFLERHVGPQEGVFVDPFGFTDIVIVHAARIPAARSATLAWTRTPSPTLGRDPRAHPGLLVRGP